MAKGNFLKGTTAKPAKGSKGSSWSFEDHSSRVQHQMERQSKKQSKSSSSISKNGGDGRYSNYYKRSFLAHDGKDQIESKKILLHITKLKRDIEKWRTRLSRWDDIDEERREKAEQLKIQQELQKQQELEEQMLNGTKKRKRRPGPETWKLRGAARPAWEIYDFDTRYVDPYLKEHEEAKQKAKRSRNVLVLYKGQFGREREPAMTFDSSKGPPQPACRNFLMKLVQLGHLCKEAKKFKSAREAFLECIALEGGDETETASTENNDDKEQRPLTGGGGGANITNARSHLMRMYMEANRPDSARRLWERFPMDPSAWIRYSAALVEFVSWTLLKEEGSTQQTAERLLSQAIQSNVYCAFYLAYFSHFESVMEFTQDIEEAGERSLEEAIEYCNSEQTGAWLGTDGALQWIQNTLLQVMQTGKSPCGCLNRTHLNWKDSLTEAENLFSAQQQQLENEDQTEAEKTNEESGKHHQNGIKNGNSASNNHGSEEEEDDNSDEDDDEEEEPDFMMYAGMFRTAMEMLEEAGEFQKPIVKNNDEESDDEKNE